MARWTRLALVVWAAASCAPNGAFEASLTGGQAAPGASALTELFWIAPRADKVRLLTEAPGECLRAAGDPQTAYLVEVGRAAFASPLLFGGQAARAGVSCASCHPAGRANDAFFIEGLSGAPGTADVTSSLFSKVREDGIFNPAPIPTLVGIGEKRTFGTRAPASSLHDFIKSAVTDEFQGPAPSDAVLDGLAAYVAHLDPEVCPREMQIRSAGKDMDDVVRIIEAARAALSRGDAATADFLLVSTQSALGRVHERFAARGFERQRQALEALSRALGEQRRRARDDESLAEIARRMQASGQMLDDAVRGSYYDAEILKDAFAAHASFE